MWRLGLGRVANLWPAGTGRMLVIEHAGRKSGTAYLTPVNYTRTPTGVYCIAAFGDRTDWYRNLMAQPSTALWMPDGRWIAECEDVSERADRAEIMRQVLIDSGFAAHLVGLHPRTMTEAELAEATQSYLVLRFDLTRKEAIEGGPGSLSWVWLLVGGVVVMGRACRRLRSRCLSA